MCIRDRKKEAGEAKENAAPGPEAAKRQEDVSKAEEDDVRRADNAASAAAFVAALSQAERRRLLTLVHSDRAAFAEALKASDVIKVGFRLKVELLLKENAIALSSITCEPARARAIDLVLIGHLLSAQLSSAGGSSKAYLSLIHISEPTRPY